MDLKLMYITNNVKIAKIAEDSGVDWIFIDLEINGKVERQGHLDTVISRHSIDDVSKIKKVLNTSELLVRINPIYDGSKSEINRVINDGADIVMLPYFKTKEEVETFIDYVDGRAKACLLLETPEAVSHIDSIINIPRIDYIHIGLNDLHIGYNMKFMFEPLADGMLDMLCNKFKNKGIHYGFGGIANLGYGDLPAENIIPEHYRLGSTMAILSRSFCDTRKIEHIDSLLEIFKKGIAEIRLYEKELKKKQINFFEHNHDVVKKKVEKLVKNKYMKVLK